MANTTDDHATLEGLNRGYLVTTILAMLGFGASVYLLLQPVAGAAVQVNQLYLIAAGVIGILTAYAFVWITQYYTEISQHQGLYAKYKALRESAAFGKLAPAQKRVIENELRDFRLGGAELAEKDKARFMEIRERLSQLS